MALACQDLNGGAVLQRAVMVKEFPVLQYGITYRQDTNVIQHASNLKPPPGTKSNITAVE